MPRPTDATAVQREDLGAIAYEYTENARNGFIGLSLMPIFESAVQTAEYPVIPLEALLKMPDVNRTPEGNYNRGGWKFETDLFKCKEKGWEEPVDDVEAELYARFFDAETVSTERAVKIIERAQEKRIQGILQNTSNFSNAAVTTEWDTSATCTPRSDVFTAKEAMRTSAGVIPNVGACSMVVLNSLLLAAEIQDALKYTNPLEMGGLEAQLAQLAKYFGLDRLEVAGAQYDSAKQGQTAVLADLWDDEYFGLYNVSSGGLDLREPVVGRTFLWTGDSPQNTVVESYRDETVRGDIIRVRHNVDEEIIYAGAGYLLTNITT